jgi:hypothetical protein
MPHADDLTAEILGDERSEAPRDQDDDGATPDTLLTRRQAARELGKHVSTVRRLERKAALRPIRGDDGVHRFSRKEVRALRDAPSGGEADDHGRAGGAPRRPDAFDNGDTTAAVFALFAGGTAPVDVVVRLKLPAAAVATLYRQWVELQGGFVVSLPAAREIAALRGATILDEASLLESLRAALPNTHCTQCHEELLGHEALCRPCARRIRIGRIQELADQAAREKARKQQQKELQKQIEKFDKEHDARMRDPPRGLIPPRFGPPPPPKLSTEKWRGRI